MSGYHIAAIPKGVVGDISKIEEELLELKDSVAQGNKCMALLECSDLLGAIDSYIQKEFNNSVTIEELLVMTRVTQKVFVEGYRT